MPYLNPFFFCLLQGKICRLCRGSFTISEYTTNNVNETSTIVFPLKCYEHPLHAECFSIYRSNYLESKANEKLHCTTCACTSTQFKCPTCSCVWDEDDNGCFVWLNSMYPSTAPPDTSLPLAPRLLKPSLTTDFKVLMGCNPSSGCCKYPHLYGEYFSVFSPCGHSIHTRCYLNLLFGDMVWLVSESRTPKTVYCPCNFPIYTRFDHMITHS